MEGLLPTEKDNHATFGRASEYFYFDIQMQPWPPRKRVIIDAAKTKVTVASKKKTPVDSKIIAKFITWNMGRL